MTVNGSGWFLAAFGHVGDDDGMTGYLRMEIDGTIKINDFIHYRTVSLSGEPTNLVVPLRFNTKLVISHRVAAVNTGIGTTVIYDLD